MPAEKVILVCDHRERAVLVHANKLADIEYKTQQMTTGDYAVMVGGKILTIIERKSLEDFAASFKDGRANNRLKLLSLRDITGCKIIYIIEGKPFPKPSDTFGHISYANIESSIFHLMVRDGISVIWTRDTSHTAETLARFVKSMESLVQKGEESMDNQVQREEAEVIVPIVDENNLLSMKHERSDMDVMRELWACFKGVTVETADIFINKFKLSDIIAGKITRETIETLRGTSGRKISKTIVKSLTFIDRSVEIRLLSIIPGISTHSANNILRGTKLSQILSYDTATVSVIKVGKSGKNLGEEKSKRIKKYFDFVPPVTKVDDNQANVIEIAENPKEIILNEGDKQAIDEFLATM